MTNGAVVAFSGDILAGLPDTNDSANMSESIYQPIQIRLSGVYGIAEALRAMRLPHESRGDSIGATLGSEDAKLAASLILAGDDHAKAMRGILAYFDIDMQVGFLLEFETYRSGVECLSTTSSMHNELRQLCGEPLAERKQQDLPQKYYTRSLYMSYQTLRRVYRARRAHRHPDWRLFCQFIETLPYFHQLIWPERQKETHA